MSWPELSEELARKSLDTFERAVHAYLIEEKLTAHELRIVIDTLVDTIQGLVPYDVVDTIYNTRKELNLE